MEILAWLFSRTKRKRYVAALVILSAAYAYRRLEPEESRRVEEEANEILKGKYCGDVIAWPAAVYRRFAGWHFIAALHAVAMARLGLPALVEWPSQLARSKTPNREANRLFTDFRALDPQTEAALTRLRAIAPDIETLLPSTLDDPSHDEADMYGPRRTVREKMRGSPR